MNRGIMFAPLRIINKRRATITALPLYYSGSLQKKYIGEKDFKLFFGELRGSSLFLYTDEAQSTYAEKLDLRLLNNLNVDSPSLKAPHTVLTLSFHREEVQLKMDSLETAEEWRGFILTLARMEIPKYLQLLPGQRLRMEEVLEQEMKREAPPLPANPKWPIPISSPSSASPEMYDDVISGVPACFFLVSRQKAAEMLEETPGNGSIILRPSTTAEDYAVTIRQVYPSGPVTKHYKIRSVGSGFDIELDEPVTVQSLQEVVDYFVTKTDSILCPYLLPPLYETHIEKPPTASVHSPMGSNTTPMMPKSPPPPPAPDKTVVKERIYMVPDDNKKLLSSQPRIINRDLADAIHKLRAKVSEEP